MHKYRAIIRNIAFFSCFLSIVLGCEHRTDSPQKAKIVSKKIVVSKKVSQPQHPKKANIPKSFPQKKALKQKLDFVKTGDDKTEKKEVASLSETLKAEKLFDTSDLYNPKGKIDPFEPLFKEEPKAKKKPEKVKKKTKRRIPLTPLEKVDLSQLKLSGIIQAASGNRALVETASGKGYIITKGAFLGLNAGQAVKIAQNKVIVYEPLLPVNEVKRNSIYDVNGKTFFIYDVDDEKYIDIDGKKYKAKISKIDGKAYYVEPRELKLQKPPGEE